MIVIVFGSGYFLLAPPVLAHLGGGPPFLRVDGIFAKTNPYYQGTVTLNIPLDMAQKPQLINVPVVFSVDIPSLQKQTFMPPDFFHNVKFRWSYASGDNFDQASGVYQYGNRTTYIFSHPQSYLVTLEAKSPMDQGFVVVDNVQVNVIPSVGYVLPHVALFIGTHNLNPLQPVRLVSQSIFDPTVTSAHYLWDFGEKKLEAGKSIDHTFQKDIATLGVSYIYHRVVDDNGLITDIGLQVENTNGKLNFHPFGNMSNIPVRYGTYQDAIVSEKNNTAKLRVKKTSFPFAILVGFLIFIFLSFFLRFIRTRNKKRKFM